MEMHILPEMVCWVELFRDLFPGKALGMLCHELGMSPGQAYAHLFLISQPWSGRISPDWDSEAGRS